MPRSLSLRYRNDRHMVLDRAAIGDLRAPTEVPNLRTWWESDRVVGISGGGAVPTIPDASGLGFDLSSVGPTSATFQLAQLNGYPAIRFLPVGAGGDQGGVKFQTAVAPWSGTRSFTAIAVLRPSNVAATNAQIWATTSGFRVGWNAATRKSAFTVTGIATYNSNSIQHDNGVPRIVAWGYDHNQKVVADYFTGAAGWLDTSQPTGTPGGGVGIWYLGNQETGNQNNVAFYGDFFAWLVFDRLLNPWELRALLKLYARKYAIAEPALWTPASESVTSCWLRAKAITGVGDGVAMTQWTDGSGRGNHGTAVNAPRYRARARGKPAVELWNPDPLNPLPPYFTLPSASMGLVAGGVFLAFRAFRDSAAVPGREGLFGRARVNSPGTYLDVVRQDEDALGLNAMFRFLQFDVGRYAPSYPANTSQLVGVDYDTTTDDHNLYRNGRLRAAVAGTEDKPPMETGGVVVLGRRSPTESIAGFHGNLQELVLTDALPTPTQRRRYDEWLATEHSAILD
jgi:hypothetical protein